MLTWFKKKESILWIQQNWFLIFVLVKKSDANGDVRRGFNSYLIWCCSCIWIIHIMNLLLLSCFHSSSDMDLSSLVAGLFNRWCSLGIKIIPNHSRFPTSGVESLENGTRKNCYICGLSSWWKRGKQLIIRNSFGVFDCISNQPLNIAYFDICELEEH